jgi:predicted transcriptional regulator
MDKLTNDIRVKIDDNTHQKIKEEAESRHLTFSDIVRQAIYEYIGSKNAKVEK